MSRKILAILFLLYPGINNSSQYNSISQSLNKIYSFKKLPRCNEQQENCTTYLNDTTSIKKIVKCDNKWIELVYPSDEIMFNKVKYIFHQDLKSLSNSDLKNVTFIPESITGYLIENPKRKYILIYGGILGSTGISGSYSLVIILQLNKSKHLNARSSYGGIIKDFNIKSIGDFDNDGCLDIRVSKTERITLK